MQRLGFLLATWIMANGAFGEDAFAKDAFVPDRCELMPLPGHQVSFRIGGIEKTRWHFGAEYPRPFFYPFNGVSGQSLTRIGHPGAPNHDHHRSVWFAHNNVAGVDFWSDNTDARVRQKQWYAYRDGTEEAIMAAATGWYDGTGKELMEQEVVAALLPLDPDAYGLELQLTMRPPSGTESVQLGKTNFGFLAVRVAKTLSVHFGGGVLSSSEGQRGEESIFGTRARWMDYSGPIVVGQEPDRKIVTEGITYFDHPSNPRYPTYWHVRSDGWMGASFNMHEDLVVTADKPLVLRYLLVAHPGPYDQARSEVLHSRFAERPGFLVGRGTQPHQQLEVTRAPAVLQ